MTQIDQAREGIITKQVELAANAEGVDPNVLRVAVAEGMVAIPFNKNRKANSFCAVGGGLSTKVNANIGTSMDMFDLDVELAKLKAAVDAGADAVMDLSTGGNLREVRAAIIENSPICVGSVPIYEAAVKTKEASKTFVDATEDDMLEAVRMHCEDGVDFVTVHCGVTQRVVEEVIKAKRVCGIVSRGGSFLAEWIHKNKKENPLYTHYDEILKMCKEYDVTLSLGDGLRPGALADAMDSAQIAELMVLGELCKRARAAGVQTIIEGPGHVPMNQVGAQVQLMKELCDNAPFYVLGPIVTDIAPGYDHITSAIGGAIAASVGADFLCYVTPSEHLRLPNENDVHEGVMAARIAAHAADIAKGVPGAFERNKEFSRMRRNKDWEGMINNSIDPAKARRIRSEIPSQDEELCSMCGDFCVFRDGDRPF